MKTAKQEAKFQKGKRQEGASVSKACKRRVKKMNRREGKKAVYEHGVIQSELLREAKVLIENARQRGVCVDVMYPHMTNLVSSLATATPKIGEEVHFCGYSVTKPTHERRGTRQVKVRYEEGRSYWNDKGEIDEIVDGGYKVGGRLVRNSDICESQEAAYEKAHQQDISYKESCEFASMCR